MLVVMPSTMTQAELDNLRDYMLEGNPTMVLIDPLPVFDISLSPLLPPGQANSNPFMQQNQPQQEPKGNIAQFMYEIGVSWFGNRVIWDSYNPHPDLAEISPEVIFVGKGNGNPEPFNSLDEISSDLQEFVFNIFRLHF